MSSLSSSIRNSFGLSLNQTYKFKEFRRKHFQKKANQPSKSSTFKGSEKLLDSFEAIEKVKACIPPQWVDDYDNIKEELKTLEDDLKLLEKTSLSRVLNTFKKESQDSESKFRLQSDSVSRKIQEADFLLKKFLSNQSSPEDKNIKKNVISSLKIKLRDFTLKFKKIQDRKRNKNSIGDFDNEIYNFSEDFEDRDKVLENTHEGIMNQDIENLAKNMIDLSEIFKELNEFIVLQGTILDRIDYSLQSAVENTKESVKHLKGAEKHQKCTRASGCIVLLLVVILVLLVTMGLKVYL